MSYKLSLRIERDDRTMAEVAVSVEETPQELAKGKRTITRTMNEYAPAVTLPPVPEEPAPQVPTEAEPETTQDTPQKGTRGLLWLHCPKCSRLFGTFLNEVRSDLLCKCGHLIDLTAPLAPYHFVCPSCKKMTWGKTNLEDPELVIQCKCGKTIELDWVPGAKTYQLVKKEA